MNEKRFKVAISFPGECRGLVSEIAYGIATIFGRKSVFYDDFYTSELAIPNLDLYLQKNIFRRFRINSGICLC